MGALSATRPLFHSEADFQHALAWQLQRQHPSISIRLEYRSRHLTQRGYVDIWIVDGDDRVGLELKYKTRPLKATVAGEDFELLGQGAQDHGRYDTLNEVQRLEQVVAAAPRATGFLLLLTNDRSYWTASGRPGSIDEQFRLHDERTVTGALKWAQALEQVQPKDARRQSR
jgi:hypothetical protein